MKNIIKNFVDLIYRTSSAEERIHNENPTETVITSDACKAIIKTANSDVKRGLDWVTSQRAVIILTNKKIICGKWTILIEDIIEAKLVKFKSMFFAKGQVLKIQTKDNKYYQFGMQNNPAWLNQSVLPITIEEKSQKNSIVTIIIRVVLIIYLIYSIYTSFRN